MPPTNEKPGQWEIEGSKKAKPRGSRKLYLQTSIPQMLYQNDLHPTPTLHLTSKNWIEIPVPEDTGYALVQIRTTGPGGDGIPAEVHIVRNGGTASPLPLSTPSSPGPQTLVTGLSPGANSDLDLQGERRRQARMNSSYVIVPPPPQNHPRAWKESAPLLWKCKGLETKSKGPSQCPMSKAKSTSGRPFSSSPRHTPQESSQPCCEVRAGWVGLQPHTFPCWFQAQA